MKTMTCKQLGGACDKEFQAEIFEEMVELAKAHGMEMFQKNDEAHIKVMSEVQELMNDPAAMMNYIAEKKKIFDELE